MMRDWAAVPAAADISERLANDADYVRFRSVCTSWRSAAPKRPQIPWLLVEFKDESGNRALGLCNYPNTTDLQLVFNPQPPEGTSGWEFVCGSSRGWIGLLDDAPGISLYKPFTQAHVRLPLLTDLPEFSDGCRVKKSAQGFGFYKRDGTRSGAIHPFHFYGTFLANHVVLSSDPSDDNCVVMAISYNGARLIYCRPGDATWTPLSPASITDLYRDIIFFKGRFFAVSDFRLFVCDIGPDAATVTEILPAHPLFYPLFSQNSTRPRRIDKSYLVVSDGELLLATITDESDYFNPNGGHICEVFRVDLDGGQLKLFKLENLSDRALFLGLKTMSVSVGGSPCCRGNCIYFSKMTSVKEPDSDPTCLSIRLFDRVGVYNMEDGTTSFIPSLPNNAWGAHWLTPNLGY